MIFLTVGSWHYDELIRAADEISREYKEKFVAQIGIGKYIPRNIEYFRFAPSLEPYYSEASLVIGHGGAGTIFELMKMGKPYIGVQNPGKPDNHQVELLEITANKGYILWCKDVSELRGHIEKARKFAFTKYVIPPSAIGETILKFFEAHHDAQG